MRRSNQQRLPTPTQRLSLPTPGLYRPQNGRPQQYAPIQTTRGYLPQQRWSQEHHSVPEGSRAIPLRMQRTAMNRTEIRPMPIPSLKVSADRPYSVPNYLTQRARSEAYGGISHPQRPATSSKLYDIDELVPQRPAILSGRRALEEVEDDLVSYPVVSEDAELQVKPSTTTRRVARRGSRASSQPSNIGDGDPNSAPTSFDPKSSKLAVGHKRAAENTAVESYPPKRIKIKAVRSKSQTPVASNATRRTSSMAYPYAQSSQISNASYTETVALEEFGEDVWQLGDDETVAQGSDIGDNIAEAAPMSKNLSQLNLKPDPYDIMDEPRPVERRQKVMPLDEIRCFDNTNISGGIPRTSTATLWESPVYWQSHTVAHHRYTNASAQCDMSPKAAPKVTQIEPEGEYHPQPAPLAESTPIPQDNIESGLDDEDLDAQLSRIEEVIRTQDEKGMAQFIEERLSTGDSDVLETLTNEIILGFIAHDTELLEKMIQIV
ncbi:hypothetical protein F5Y04DRAFT_260968 [Hypomontagnella monticulosa]|nr:hypothetical protein F5Y04DRAFT_260968 [Hypomontagnella monticulosa]